MFAFNCSPENDLPGEYAYAYRDYHQQDVYYDSDGDYIRLGRSWTRIELTRFPILRFTPKGFVIEVEYGKEKFINPSWRKKFACLNITLAKESFMKKKQAQLRILDNQLSNCKHAIHLGKEDKFEEKIYKPIMVMGRDNVFTI